MTSIVVSSSGLVVSTSSRFYTVIRPAHPSFKNQIHARSPQFLDANWRYDIHFTEATVAVQPITADGPDSNRFVHLTLQSALSLAVEVNGTRAIENILSQGAVIDIVGDNDFYSQQAQLESLGLPRQLDSLKQIPPFNRMNVPLSKVHKTGLGSSAALITSLVAALLLHLDVCTCGGLADERSEDRLLVHNLSQLAHCFAQGKVGSGFDVAAAVFGSQIYTRFDPAVMKGFLERDEVHRGPLLPIATPSNPGWNYSIQPFKLPPLTRLLLADVDTGSDTPSLVGKVLKWRREHESGAHGLWTTLDQWNQSLSNTLTKLSELQSKDPECYSGAVKYLSTLQPLQWLANPNIFPEEVPIVTAFYEVHQITNAIREHMRQMGELAGAPIEPPEQTKLLDVCVTQAGVIGGGVPGAGGYDAIWLLVTDPVDCAEQERPLRRVEYVWSTWKDMNVTPLMAEESKAKGLAVEDLDQVPGLKEALSP